jgi:hypothetical protein
MSGKHGEDIWRRDLELGGITYIFFHCRSINGVGDSIRRGTVKVDNPRVAPPSNREEVIPKVCARRIVTGASVDILMRVRIDSG